MRKANRAVLACWVIVLVSVCCAAQSGKVESLGPLSDNAVPDAVRQSLDAKGYRLTLDDPKSTCELWLRKSVPASTAKESDNIVYPEFAESVMLGVIHFPDAAADFRGHKIPAGFYTMRYELMPDDGNHLGAAPNRDFVLLIPAASDTDPSAAYKFQELSALSAATAGTKHPAPLSLVPADKPGAGTVARDEQDHWIFSSNLKLASGNDLPFALIVKGTAQQ